MLLRKNNVLAIFILVLIVLVAQILGASRVNLMFKFANFKECKSWWHTRLSFKKKKIKNFLYYEQMFMMSS